MYVSCSLDMIILFSTCTDYTMQWCII